MNFKNIQIGLDPLNITEFKSVYDIELTSTNDKINDIKIGECNNLYLKSDKLFGDITIFEDNILKQIYKGVRYYPIAGTVFSGIESGNKGTITHIKLDTENKNFSDVTYLGYK